jgi:FixJ family two-component response regulator
VTKALLIAVVDDDDAIRRALTRLLRASGFNVIMFASGQTFIDSLSGQRPDCVVMDFQMPGLTGGDVQRLLMLAEIHLPIIIMTAYDHAGIREECLGNGAVACLVKCDLQLHLLAAIETVTGS